MLSADPHSEVLDPLTPTLSPRSRVGRGGHEKLVEKGDGLVGEAVTTTNATRRSNRSQRK